MLGYRRVTEDFGRCNFSLPMKTSGPLAVSFRECTCFSFSSEITQQNPWKPVSVGSHFQSSTAIHEGLCPPIFVEKKIPPVFLRDHFQNIVFFNQASFFLRGWKCIRFTGGLKNPPGDLGGGWTYFLFSPLLGEDFQLDEITVIFLRWAESMPQPGWGSNRLGGDSSTVQHELRWVRSGFRKKTPLRTVGSES